MKHADSLFATAALAVTICAAGITQGRNGGAPASDGGNLALQIADYAALPITGSPDGTGNNAGSLARVNFLRDEPASTRRLFVNDLTGPLYILDRNTKKLTTYLDLNGRGTRPGLFDKLVTESGLASGFISFEFDPDYARNGRFYSIHLEEVAAQGELSPDNTSIRSFKTGRYIPTLPIQPPGNGDHEAVLIEWKDSNISNWSFEGTARELMRIRLNSRIHPVGDLIFNPAARRGDPDWRVLYVAYPLREGTEMLQVDGSLDKLPDIDAIPVHVTGEATTGTVVPTYPVVQYGHGQRGGDAIAGGFVYRGAAVPQLRGKYVFGDISTGRLWYADYMEMRAADDGSPRTLAEPHELGIWWDNPEDAPDSGRQLYATMAPIVLAGYHSRGGKDLDLPGTGAVSGPGRVDLRLAMDRAGELYLLSKSDGMIRVVTGVTAAPAAK